MKSKRLIIAFPIQESDDHTSIDFARAWGEAVSATVHLFVNRPSSKTMSLLLDSGLDWIDLKLAPHVNRYHSSPMAKVAWDPWGFKSGPNRDFFRILNYCSKLDYEWMLLAEPDLIPIEHDLVDRVITLLNNHSEQWVVGAQTTDESRGHLDFRIHDHINGSAFYHVGSPDFHQFCRRVWIPSLIAIVKNFPSFAYDCVTASQIRQWLPCELKAAWESNENRFIATPKMINQSNIHISQGELNSLILSYRKRQFISLHTKIFSKFDG